MKNKKVIAIIPARGGSKGIPGKNIVNLGGYPLIAYSIAAAKLSSCIDRVVVSTDDQKIADIALQYGAEVPFLRPKELAEDNSPDIDFMAHAIDWFLKYEKEVPEYWVHLRPTTPLRNPNLVDQAIDEFVKKPEATSLRSAHELREPPHKFFQIKNSFFEGLFSEDKRPDYHNLPRQAFPAAYHPNGYVDVLKTETIQKLKVMHGSKILPYITEELTELDRPADLAYIAFDLQRGHYEIYNYLKEHFKSHES